MNLTIKFIARAFLDEFKEEKDVMLFLRTDIPGHQSLNHEMQREGSTFDSRVRLLPRQERYRYQEMFAAADAFILASHGEGWGRPILEGNAHIISQLMISIYQFQ